MADPDLVIKINHPEDYESDPYLWYKMIYPDDKMIVDNSIKEILAGHKVSPIEHRIIRRDVAVVWVRNTIVDKWENDQVRHKSISSSI